MEIQWPLVIFSLLAGSGGGLLVFTGISEALGIARGSRKIAVMVALVLFVLGGCASLLHLGQPANIMAAATNVFSFSGVSVELIMLGVNVVLGVVYLFLIRGDEPSPAARIVAVIGIATGCLMAFVVGNGYVIESQPYWNNLMLPLSYLGSGLALGAALFVSLMVVRKEQGSDIKKLSIYVLVAAVIQLLAFLAYGAVIGFEADALIYWGCVIALGGVGTLASSVFVAKMPSFAYAACACALVGGLAFRVMMWMLGTGFLDFFSDAAMKTAL